MPITDDALEQILAAEGWPFERIDATTWRSGFQELTQSQIRDRLDALSPYASRHYPAVTEFTSPAP